MAVIRNSRTPKSVLFIFATMAAVVAASCAGEPDTARLTASDAHDHAAAVAVAGGSPATTTTETPLPLGDVVATALTNHVFTELAGLAIDAGLIETLRGGPFTVFAPTDAAFDKLPLEALHAIQDDPPQLAQLLTHHVVSGSISPDQLVPGELTTVAGTILTITEVDGVLFANGMPIGAGVEASNGYVYIMSDVLLVP